MVVAGLLVWLVASLDRGFLMPRQTPDAIRRVANVPIYDAAILESGDLVVGTGDGQVLALQPLELADGRVRTLVRANAPIQRLAASPDGHVVASVDADEYSLYAFQPLFKTRSDRPREIVLPPFRYVTSLQFLSGHEFVAATEDLLDGTSRGGMHVIDSQLGKVARVLTNPSNVSALATGWFNSRLVVVASDRNGAVFCFDYPGWRVAWSIALAHGRVWAVAVHGPTTYCATDDGLMALRTESGALMAPVTNHRVDDVYAVAGRLITREGDHIVVRDSAGWRVRRRYCSDVGSVAVSGHGVLAIAFHSEILLLDLNQMRDIVWCAAPSRGYAVRLAPRDRVLCAYSDDGTCRVWRF